MNSQDLEKKVGFEIGIVNAHTFGKNFVEWDIESYKGQKAKVRVPLEFISLEEAKNILEIPSDSRIQPYEVQYEIHNHCVGVFLEGANESPYCKLLDEEIEFPVSMTCTGSPVQQMVLDRTIEIGRHVDVLYKEIARLDKIRESKWK